MMVSPWKAARGFLFGVSLLLLFCGCAGQGPLVLKPPTVEVDRLVSLSIRPKVVKFDGTILIRNAMKTDLDLERVDWAVDLFDRELFSSSFNHLKRTAGGGTQAVSFPFQIEMKDIMDRAAEAAAERSVKLVFRGNLYVAGPFSFGPIPFRKTLELPFPRIPEIAFKGTEGTPFADSFTIRLRITNAASFSFTINSVDAHLRAGKRIYRLSHAQNLEPVGPTGSREIELRMRDASSPDPVPARLDLIGTVQCSTAFGWIFIPVTVEDLLK